MSIPFVIINTGYPHWQVGLCFPPGGYLWPDDAQFKRIHEELTSMVLLLDDDYDDEVCRELGGVIMARIEAQRLDRNIQQARRIVEEHGEVLQ